jgi:hypothetical protein
LLASAVNPLAALNGGYRIAFIVGSLFALAAALLGALLLRAEAQPPAQESKGTAVPDASRT